jgi:hypothetical protein
MRKKQLDEQKAVVAAARSFGPVGATSSDVLAVLAADDERAKELLRALSRSSSKLPPSFWERSGSGGMLSTLGKVHPLVRQRVPGIPSVIYVARDYIHVAVCRDAAAGRLRVCPLCGSSLFEYGVVGGTFDARCRIVPLLKRALPLVMCSACFRGLWSGSGETSSAHCVQRGSAADVAVFPVYCRCDSCRLGAGTMDVAEKMLTATVVDIVSTFGRTGATSNDVLRCLHACCFRNSRMQSRWRIGIHRDRGPFGRREWRRGRVQARVRSILSRNSSKRIVAVDPKPLQRIARTRHRHVGAGSASETELAYIAIQHANGESSGQSPRPTSTDAGAASAQRPLSGTGGTAAEEFLLEVVLSPLVRIEVAIRVNADFARLLLPPEGETARLVRQYSDLIWLRNALSTAYPTVEVPKLPEDSAPPPAVVVLAMVRADVHDARSPPRRVGRRPPFRATPHEHRLTRALRPSHPSSLPRRLSSPSTLSSREVRSCACSSAPLIRKTLQTRAAASRAAARLVRLRANASCCLSDQQTAWEAGGAVAARTKQAARCTVRCGSYAYEGSLGEAPPAQQCGAAPSQCPASSNRQAATRSVGSV